MAIRTFKLEPKEPKEPIVEAEPTYVFMHDKPSKLPYVALAMSIVAVVLNIISFFV